MNLHTSCNSYNYIHMSVGTVVVSEESSIAPLLISWLQSLTVLCKLLGWIFFHISMPLSNTDLEFFLFFVCNRHHLQCCQNKMMTYFKAKNKCATFARHVFYSIKNGKKAIEVLHFISFRIFMKGILWNETEMPRFIIKKVIESQLQYI